MSQLYVPEGTFLVCSEGMKKNQLKGGSQTSIYISGGKLATTINDRFEDNFICGKMMLAGAIVGAIVAAAVVAAIILSGGTIGIGIAMAVGAVGATQGAVMGASLSIIPSICSLLCTSSKWYPVHDKVLLQNQPALLETSQITCSFGGHIMIFYSEKTADEFVALARNNAIIKIGSTILGGALLSAAIAGILSSGVISSFFKNVKYVFEKYRMKGFVNYLGENATSLISKYLAGKSADYVKDSIYEYIQEKTDFRLYDYIEGMTEEADEEITNYTKYNLNENLYSTDDKNDETDIEDIVREVEEYTEDLTTPNISNFDEIGYEKRTLYITNQGALPEDYDSDITSSEVNSNIIRERNPRVTRLPREEINTSSMQERFHHREDWYMIEGEQMELTPTGRMINDGIKNFKGEFVDSFKEPFTRDYYKNKQNVLGIFQDLYIVLTSMLIEGNIDDFKDSKKDEKQARKNITVITTTR